MFEKYIEVLVKMVDKSIKYHIEINGYIGENFSINLYILKEVGEYLAAKYGIKERVIYSEIEKRVRYNIEIEDKGHDVNIHVRGKKNA